MIKSNLAKVRDNMHNACFALTEAKYSWVNYIYNPEHSLDETDAEIYKELCDLRDKVYMLDHKIRGKLIENGISTLIGA